MNNPLSGLIALVLVVSMHAGATMAATPRQLAAQLDEFMQQQVKHRQFSGAVLVVRDGRVLLEKGYGFANREWNQPISSDTKFRIGSLTKQFTATVILQLREQGLLDTGDAICKFVQPCPEAWNAVTLHHLLSHTSGIQGVDQPLKFTPGAQWAYSDPGYSLLGKVIEKVKGKPYEEVVRAQIFDPLGMKDSGYDHPEALLARRASGYRVKDGKVLNAEPTTMVAPFAAGGLYSTASDLYKWDQALYSTRLLTQASLDLMWTEVKVNYAYGWMVSRHQPGTPNTAWWATDGRFEVAHTGAIQGFTSEFLRFPNDRVTVIVLANLQDAPLIGPYLAGIVFGQPFSLPARSR